MTDPRLLRALTRLAVLLQAAVLVPALPAMIEVAEELSVEAEAGDGQAGDCEERCPGDDEEGHCPPGCDSCACCPATPPALVRGDSLAPRAPADHPAIVIEEPATRGPEGVGIRVFRPPRSILS